MAILRQRVMRRKGDSPTRTVLAIILLQIVAAIAGLHIRPALSVLTDQQPVDNNAFTTKNLVAPASLTASPVGHDVQLTWPPGQNGNGYAVLGVANGNSSNCTVASFSNIASTVGTSYTDSGRYTPQGTYFCYQVQTTYGSWYSASNNPIAAPQIGFVASSIQLVNGGVAGKLDSGDQIMITFNQAVDPASGPISSDTVCTANGATIVVGSPLPLGVCLPLLETPGVGTLTGGTSNENARWQAAWAWSNGNAALTATLGNRIAGNDPSISGTWTLNPTTISSRMLSASGAFHICDNNSGGGNCLPGTSSAP